MTESKIGHFMIAVGCIMEHEQSGDILCLKRDRSNFQKGEWELMYGRIDQHEELLDGLHREVFEETGIKVFAVKKLLRIWHIYRGEKSADKEVHGFTFHCVTKSKNVKISNEHSEYAWVSPQEAISLIRLDGIKRDVEIFLDQNINKTVISGLNNQIIF